MLSDLQKNILSWVLKISLSCLLPVDNNIHMSNELIPYSYYSGDFWVYEEWFLSSVYFK